MRIYNVIELHNGSEYEYPEVTVLSFSSLEKAINEYELEHQYFKENYDEDDFVVDDEYQFAVIDKGDDEYIEFRIEEEELKQLKGD